MPLESRAYLKLVSNVFSDDGDREKAGEQAAAVELFLAKLDVLSRRCLLECVFILGIIADNAHVTGVDWAAAAEELSSVLLMWA